MDERRPIKRNPRGGARPVQTAAQILRHTPTPAEEALWNELRGKGAGVRFRRQHPVGRFILDFYAPSAHLVVELDGSSHAGRQECDEARSEHLKEHGNRVIRFTNSEVFADLDGVVERIRCAVAEGRPSPPSPLSQQQERGNRIPQTSDDEDVA